MHVTGLIHSATLSRPSESLSYGTVTTANTEVLSAFRCRFTVLKGAGETKDEGLASANRYKVISVPLSAVPQKNDYLTWDGTDYKVLWHQKMYDEKGSYDHHAFIVESADR